jgi:hypothetical protein
MLMTGKFKYIYMHIYNKSNIYVLFSEIETMERFETHARAMEKLMPWINEASQAHKDSLDGNL